MSSLIIYLLPGLLGIEREALHQRLNHREEGRLPLVEGLRDVDATSPATFGFKLALGLTSCDAAGGRRRHCDCLCYVLVRFIVLFSLTELRSIPMFMGPISWVCFTCVETAVKKHPGSFLIQLRWCGCGVQTHMIYVLAWHGILISSHVTAVHIYIYIYICTHVYTYVCISY